MSNCFVSQEVFIYWQVYCCFISTSLEMISYYLKVHIYLILQSWNCLCILLYSNHNNITIEHFRVLLYIVESKKYGYLKNTIILIFFFFLIFNFRIMVFSTDQGGSMIFCWWCKILSATMASDKIFFSLTYPETLDNYISLLKIIWLYN